MTADRWAAVQTLLLDALDRPAEEHAAFVAQHAARDPELAAELAALLAASADVPAFLDAPPAWSLGADADAPHRASIGPYRLLREIGRGGQGRVFLAERDDVGARVALKLLHGAAAPDLLQRFLVERRVLAGLDHPRIARLLDAGMADGPEPAPYFVMEAVEGEPLMEVAARLALPLDERLRLFDEVCDAVDFAHRKLVVHRDLKPSNLLVAPGADGRLHVKLLDFGIAKLLRGDGEADSAATQTGHRLMTPAYAAPEQVLGEPVTVATDVYALGVLLYELLADVRPYEVPGSLREMVRVVCDETPPRPSARAPAARARALRGDLDTITMKALGKRPSDRYDTADALRADLRRHRDGLPVRARAQTLRYRAVRFLRRHATATAGAVLVAALLVGFGVRERALRADAEAARDEAEATAALLTDIFGASPEGDGAEVRIDTLRAQPLVDRAARRLDARTDVPPRLRSRLNLQLGHLYMGIGLQASGTARFEAAARILRGRPADAALRAEALTEAGSSYTADGRCGEATAAFGEALALTTTAEPAGLHLRIRALRAAALACLGRHGEAVADLQAVQAAADSSDAGFTLHALADFLERDGRRDEAVAAMRRSVARGVALYPPGHAVIVARRNWLSGLLLRGGDAPAAEAEARRAYAEAEARLGAAHVNTLYARLNLGRALVAQDRLDEAAPIARALLDAASALTARDAGFRARALRLHADVLAAQGRLRDAEAALREAVQVPTILGGVLVDDRVALYRRLAEILRAQGRARDAEAAERAAADVEREQAQRRTATG